MKKKLRSQDWFGKKDKDGITYYVSVNDPRYLSGELKVCVLPDSQNCSSPWDRAGLYY